MALARSSKNTVALATVCLAALMFGLEISSVPVILPTLERMLHGDFRDLQWIMNAYTIACTTVLMAAGTLADRYERKRIFIINLAAFGATSLLCGLAKDASVLIAGRFLQGLSGGGMLICLIAILSHQFQSGRERSRAFSAWGFALFVYAEKINPHPMFDFAVFKIRPFSGAILGSIGMNFSFWPLMIYLPIYFQRGLGYGVVPAGLALLAYTLPTLVIPPLAERLSLRYRPGLVIPCGMFTIGLGLLAMKCGSAMAQASWLSMSPDALLAGIGLGLTNTPVTNTTTGTLPSDRAGMASGIDMSARLITLAINIALMGLILPLGIRAYLQEALPATLDPAPWHAMAEQIAAGKPVSSLSMQTSATVARAALAHGFGWVMLYGGLGAWVLAAASYAMFGPKPAAREIGN